MFSRRQILKGVAASGLTVCIPQVHATEASYSGPFVVVFNADGGWDTTYLMDPKGTPDLNRLYTETEIRSFGNHRYAPTQNHIAPGAMSNQTFFERYGSELLVINGIDVAVNNHFPCSRYMATGELDQLHYPTFPALMAACKAPDVPLSFLTFGQYSATGNLIAQTRVPYLRSLQALANGNFTDTSRVRQYHHESVVSRIETALSEGVQASTSFHASLPKRARAHQFVYSAQHSSKSIERLIPFITPNPPQDLFLQQAEIALTAFASGLGVSANLKLGNFDSHNTNDIDQMTLIPKLLGGVDYLMNRADALGIRDQLIVIIQSEMGRTPWYNEMGGKDHWSVGSWMAMGRGIQGNRVIGGTEIHPETGADQSPTLIDPIHLQASTTGIKIKPQHIHAALRDLVGISQHEYAQRFPLNVPGHEVLAGLWGN